MSDENDGKAYFWDQGGVVSDGNTWKGYFFDREELNEPLHPSERSTGPPPHYPAITPFEEAVLALAPFIIIVLVCVSIVASRRRARRAAARQEKESRAP